MTSSSLATLRRGNVRTQKAALPWESEEVGPFPLCGGWGGPGQGVAKGQHSLASVTPSVTESCDNPCLRGHSYFSDRKTEAARVKEGPMR